jgi:hypothetical protein
LGILQVKDGFHRGFSPILPVQNGEKAIDIVAKSVYGVSSHVPSCGANTAFVERLNLDMRQRVAAGGRRVNTLCQGEDGMQHQLALFHVYHHFVLPHASRCQPLPVPESTNGSGSVKRWQSCTPAMAAGLTDHVWARQEVLMFRGPPWPQPCAV